jgi:hypothetical protein
VTDNDVREAMTAMERDEAKVAGIKAARRKRKANLRAVRTG